MKTKFANSIQMFALAVLTFMVGATVMACTGADISVLADQFTAAATGGVMTASLPIFFIMKDGIKNFVQLSDEQRENFTDEENSKYLSELIKWQTKSINDLQIAAKNDGANNVEIAKQIKSLTDASITSLKTSLEAQGGAIAKLSKELEATESKTAKTLTQAILKSLDDGKEEIAGMLKSGANTIRLDIKASQGAGDINTGTDFAEMEAGIGQLATRQAFMRSLFVNKNTSSEYVKYNDKESIVRDAKNVAACAASTHDYKITWKVLF